MKDIERENEINSLSDFIKVIKNRNLNDYYYRGENQEFSNISSSLIRLRSKIPNGINLSDYYEKLIDGYYREISSELNEVERENFLAFSQHHGISTNLIDFTSSPLTSLYFACYKGKQDISSDCGVCSSYK